MNRSNITPLFAGHDFVKRIDQDQETDFGPSMAWIDVGSKFALEKIAKAQGLSSTYIPESLQTVVESIRGRLPRDKVAFYNRALGADESYGINKNGDAWSRAELMRKHGTFVDTARYFRNHANKVGIDPDFGRPIASAFNDRTDMIDLIIVSDFDKQAQDDVQALESGDQVFTSMGCRVKYDVCKICGHQARNPSEYCEHVSKTASWPYGMCQVLSDGRVCGVMNPDPVFFDISRVRNPAFAGSENLLKVAAHAAGGVQVHAAKKEAPARRARAVPVPKTATMVKRVPAQTQAAVVGDHVITRFSHAAKAAPVPVAEAIKEAGSLTAALRDSLAQGVIWSPGEFAQGLEMTTGQKLAGWTRDWPWAADIAKVAATLPASVLAAYFVPARALPCLAKIAGDRSLLQPVLFNRLQKLASSETFRTLGFAPNGGGEDGEQRADDGGACFAPYLTYRAVACRLLAHDFPGVDVEKTADTQTRITSQASTDVAARAWTLDTLSAAALEKSAAAADTDAVLFVSASMLQDFGTETLDHMARQTLT